MKKPAKQEPINGADLSQGAPQGAPQGPEPAVPPQGPEPAVPERASPVRKRGRPSGAANKSKPEPVNRIKLADTLYGLHAMLGMAVPEFVLSTGEATALASAYADFEKAFPTFGIDPRIIASASLLGTCAIIYYPRILQLKRRLHAEARAKEQAHEPAHTPPPEPVIMQ